MLEKTLGTLDPLLDNYDADNNVSQASGAYKTPILVRDRDLIWEHLNKYAIFAVQESRSHSHFPTPPRDILHALDKQTIVQWITEQARRTPEKARRTIDFAPYPQL